MTRYNIPTFRDVNEFLLHLARQRGKLKHGGIPDIDSAAKIVLQDWNSGKIPYYTIPPAVDKNNAILDSTIVSTWSKEFNLNEIEDQNILICSKSESDFDTAMVDSDENNN
jgi:nuclear GTP-binding protein